MSPASPLAATRSLALAAAIHAAAVAAPPPSLTLNLWPGTPPGETKTLPPEADQTKTDDKLIAGRRIIKLGNVATPQITVFHPEPARASGAAVVICPGGGHHILAYDLEGTEVATWLNSVGVTGIVLKYRVPFRNADVPWLAAVQDAQRAMSLVRSKAGDWHLDPQRIGILGFSAGGQVGALVSTFGPHRQYDPTDDIDQFPSRPDFAILVYPGGLDEKDKPRLREFVRIDSKTSPMFLVHAFDDPVSPMNSILLASELKKAGVPAELHIFATGGHGYGLRHVDGLPVTDWPALCQPWLRTLRILK